jgi:PD-(D/E)XK nuclease superfamily
MTKGLAHVAISSLSASTADAQSPFITGTQIQWAWDSTCLSALKKCPRFYQLKHLEGWRSRAESVHLRFGQLYHSGLQYYDVARTAGQDHESAVLETVRQLLVDMKDWDPDDNIKNRDGLMRTVIWYLDEFQMDPAKTVTLANGKPAVEVSFKFELDFGPNRHNPDDARDWDDADRVEEHNARQPPYMLCGHLDRIVVYNDELYVMDRKTTKWTLPSPRFFDQFHPDNQMSLYSLAGQLILGSTIKGIIIDAAQIAAGFSRFQRGFTHRSQSQLDEWFTDLHYWLGMAERYALGGYWPQNDTACDKYGGCEFRRICSLSPSARKRFLPSHWKKEELWNPLKPR